MKSLIIFILSNLIIFGCIGISNKSLDENSSIIITDKTIDLCLTLDSIKYNYYYEIGNQLLTSNIDEIEEASGIKCNCNKGFAGVIYENDSIFEADFLKYKIALNCGEKKKK